MVPTFFKKLLLYSAGHTYSNLSRVFIRRFVGLLFMQFGIRQWTYFDAISNDMIGLVGMSGEATLVVVIVVEIVCSTLIMLGLLSRLAVIPPILLMLVAEDFILTNVVDVPLEMLFSLQPGYVPILFIGIFVYILLAGPGKVSLDYLMSIRFLGTDRQVEEELDKA